MASFWNSPPDAAFTKRLPKVELHAHLTGSVSWQCLQEIWEQRKAAKPHFDLEAPILALARETQNIDIVSFFQLFNSYIYKLISSTAALTQATLSVLHSFAQDGVTHLELRTTPRALPSSKEPPELDQAYPTPSLHEYVRAILSAIDFSNKIQNTTMHTSLILSVDRARHSAADAEEIVDLALAFSTSSGAKVVGIDLSGDPRARPNGEIRDYSQAFRRARVKGLGIALHLGEIYSGKDAAEVNTMLELLPADGICRFGRARVGHVVHVDEVTKNWLCENKVGVELCLSCNVLAKMTQGGFPGHHFEKWWAAGKGAKVSICTDDVGIFQSPSSNEHLLAAKHFGLSRKDLVELTAGALETAFVQSEPEEMSRAMRILRNFEAAERKL